MDRLTVYDYLSFVLPGATVLLVAVYGYYGWPWGEPGASAFLGITAGCFVTGYLIASLANGLEGVFLGGKPGSRPNSLWGTLEGPSRYTAEDKETLTAVLRGRYGEAHSLATCYRLAYTELQQRNLDERLQLVNQHLGFSRGMATGCLIALVIEVGLAVTSGTHLAIALWGPLLLLATGLFVYRFRRFWRWFGDNVLRGAALLPPPN